jgi:hypothetical protein
VLEHTTETYERLILVGERNTAIGLSFIILPFIARTMRDKVKAREHILDILGTYKDDAYKMKKIDKINGIEIRNE